MLFTEGTRGLRPSWAQRGLPLLSTLPFSELGNGKGRRKESGPDPLWGKDVALTFSIRESGELPSG